jgi:hypothetical protein
MPEKLESAWQADSAITILRRAAWARSIDMILRIGMLGRQAFMLSMFQVQG